MNNLNWLVVSAAAFVVLGIIADFAGVFGVDVNQAITVRWLLAEVVISGAIILVMAQFMIQLRQKLQFPSPDTQSLISQLENEVGELRSALESTTYQRELLQSALRVIEFDRNVQFTDPEIAHLMVLANSMQQNREKLSADDRLEIIRQTIALSCSDRNFREAEQSAIRDIATKYGVDPITANAEIKSALDRIAIFNNQQNQQQPG